MNKHLLFSFVLLIVSVFAPLAWGESTQKKAVVIIGNSMFHDLEFKALETVFGREGIQMTVASGRLSEAVGMGMLGLKVTPDITIRDIEIDAFDAVVFVGGPGAHEFTSDYIVHKLVKQAAARGKILAAIQLAPEILANAGVLNGIKAVAYLSHAIKAKGAVVTDKMVEQDGNIITARSQGAAPEFAETIVKALKAQNDSAKPGNHPFTNSIGMKFIPVPAGTFTMGSPSHEPGRHNTEALHVVKIPSPFYLQSTEVTQAQWVSIMGDNPSDFTGNDLPVERVSWNDVQVFINKLNDRDKPVRYRLPTESEWEYAARAGSTTAYFFGEDAEELDNYAWHKANSDGRTHPVAGKAPNQWGLYDMHGNVWEWVQDFYGDYPKGIATAPQGPETGAIRVRRGGGWMSTVYSCRSASRSGNEPDYKVFSVGFRLVCDPPVEKSLP